MANSKNAETKKTKSKKAPRPDEKMKYEIASELGLTDKIRENGWKSLTSKESGRIGGIMRQRKKEATQKSAD